MDTITFKMLDTNKYSLDKLPLEICDMIYQTFLFTTEDLINAINNNDLKAVRDLTNLHTKVWQMDWNMGLHDAVCLGNIEMVQMMINRGAYDLSTALSIANYKKYQNTDITKKYFEIADLLYAIMYEEDSDMWEFREYYSSF
jgi:hypothetical protein